MSEEWLEYDGTCGGWMEWGDPTTCCRCGKISESGTASEGRWFCHRCFELEVTEESPTSEWLKGLTERFGR